MIKKPEAEHASQQNRWSSRGPFGQYYPELTDKELIRRERGYWRFDPYEDIGPLFFSDLYDGDGDKERWSDWG